MDHNMYLLLNEFKKIRNMGYIKSQSASRSRAGITFENLLGKSSDELFLPDYNGIEIKTKKGYSKSPITLLSANPDSEYYFALQTLIDKYGVIKDGNKTFFLMASTQCYTRYNNYKFKLVINYEKKKLF